MILKTQANSFNGFKKFDRRELSTGVFIVVLHATRIPPHIGLIIDNYYHSLTVKGHDYNTPIPALLKNIDQRKIPSLFIKIRTHATFSLAYMREHFILNIQQFPRVENNIATCLSPIKLFFEEVYDEEMDNVHFLFDLIPQLKSNGWMESTSTLFVDEDTYELPVYTNKQLEEEIEKVRQEIKNHNFVKPASPSDHFLPN